MFTLKDEFSAIMPKSTNVETSQSKIDRVFMIIILLNLGLDLENILEQILSGPVVPNFDKVFAQLLHHSSIAT